MRGDPNVVSWSSTRLVDGAFGEMEDRVEDEPQDHVDFGSNAEFQSEVEAIVGAPESIEESDAVEVLATWKQTRTATNQEKLSRRLRVRNFPEPDPTVYIQRFSAISVIDCWRLFDFVAKPGAPTGIDDKRCATDMAIIRGCFDA